MKRLAALTIIFLLAALPCGCAKPAPQPTANPDAALVAGHWEQFIPVQSLPQTLTLDASGTATADGSNGTWRLSGDTLAIRRGGSEDDFTYTVSGYMLTLTSDEADASDFYINPDTFASGADKNAQLAGQWAAFSTFSMMNFDGSGGLDDIVYTTAGRTDLPMKYAARDGILQTEDTSRNYTYNLFDFSSDGALLLAETTDYDNPDRQWTAYWKKTEPDAGLLGDWTMAFDTQPGSTGLPSALKLQAGGKGSAEAQGAPSAADIQWECYNGGFVVLAAGANLQYAWYTAQGGVFALGNPDVDEAWYIDESRYKPDVAGLKGIAGGWKEEDTKMELDVGESGSVTAVNDVGTKTSLAAAAADGLLQLRQGGKTYYLSYSVDDNEMKLYYGDVPFFSQKEMPATLTKQ